MSACDKCSKPHVLSRDGKQDLVRCERYDWRLGFRPQECKEKR